MFGERLKELREEKGMTQQDLAVFLNVSRPSISGYENDSNDPSLDVLKKISDLFNVSADYLLDRTKERYNINLLDKTDNEVLSRLYSIIHDYKITRR